MSLQSKYVELYPARKPLNVKGKATKAYTEWCETQKDPFLILLEKKEQESTEEQKKDYKNDYKLYEKKVKRNKKLKSDPSMKDIEKLGNAKRVEAFLHPKEKKDKKEV